MPTNTKTIPLAISKVSWTGFSARKEKDIIVQVAASVLVDYADSFGNIVLSKDETVYSGTFKDIVGAKMPPEVLAALTTLDTHFAKLAQTIYGVLPS